VVEFWAQQLEIGSPLLGTYCRIGIYQYDNLLTASQEGINKAGISGRDCHCSFVVLRLVTFFDYYLFIL
jgi:hypothetical protein